MIKEKNCTEIQRYTFCRLDKLFADMTEMVPVKEWKYQTAQNFNDSYKNFLCKSSLFENIIKTVNNEQTSKEEENYEKK